jgi:1-acyl-sn-glycerol-3-phosphate acyltransferase
LASQFALLAQRRFGPFFVTQGLGAFNDNLLKNALVILATYQTARYTQLEPALLTNLAGGLFILPYLLFSGWAGQLTEKYDKALVMRLVKASEVLIMGLAGLGFAQHNLVLLLAALFLMGCHSTMFAPAKYGLLPQVLRNDELIGGNAMVEMGTFVAILLGTLAAGELARRDDTGLLIGGLVVVALAGLAASFAVPRIPATSPGLRIDWNPWTSSWANVRAATRQRSVLLSILGISWFWFYGALVLAQLPLYASGVLNANEQVLSLLLMTFSIGVGTGSLLCEKLSGRRVEIGLVPFGSIGLTVFAVDLFFATPVLPAAAEIGPAAFLAQPGTWRILADIALIGIFGGFFIVPLYAFVQKESRPDEVSRIIAANNILNALFMVAAALLGAFALQLGATVPQVILMTAVLNAVVALYIYSLVPEFLLRFLAWIIVKVMYRVQARGVAHIPAEGAALLVCNHVSFVDAIVISALCPRPIRFIMESAIFRIPILSAVFRGMKAVPIASQKSEPETYARAFELVSRELRDGQLVCIFPEGKLTGDGEIDVFRPGMMRVLERDPVPVVPMALSNLWRSMFSRRHKALWQKWPRRFMARITLEVGAPIAPAVVSPELARERVAALREQP